MIQELDEEEMIMEEEDEEDDLVFNEEMDYLEGITSCNKVENCVILSEYEQNLMKESNEVPSGLYHQPHRMQRLRDPTTKKWFLYKKRPVAPAAMEAALANRGKKWNQVLPGPSKEMATVIEETSTV